MKSLLVTAVLGLCACSKSNDVVVANASSSGTSKAAIDSDPWALLPQGAVGIGVLNAKELFASEFGSSLLAITRQQAPFPQAAGFEPDRDLERLYVGLYSMQGADFAGVAVGRFDPVKIEAAADGKQTTPLGLPLTKSTFAGRTLYTAGTLGFSVLTERTVIIGNNTGIRRALERVQEQRVKRQLPPWADAFFTTAKAPLAFGADLRSSPVPDAARQQVKFLNGLETLSLIGNFQAPGSNLAGTLAYSDENAAREGAAALRAFNERLEAYRPMLEMLGLPQPVRSIEAQEKGKQAEVAIGLEAQAINKLLLRAQEYLGINPEPSASSLH